MRLSGCIVAALLVGGCGGRQADSLSPDSGLPFDAFDASSIDTSSVDASAGTDVVPEVVVEPEETIDAGCFVYSDMFCRGGGLPCQDVGDGKCYRRCTTSADCKGSTASVCTRMHLFSGGDACGPSLVVRVCMEEEMKGCGPVDWSTDGSVIDTTLGETPDSGDTSSSDGSCSTTPSDGGCALGCEATRGHPYDAKNNCLRPLETVLCGYDPTDADASWKCRVRISDGTLFFFGAAAPAPDGEWAKCEPTAPAWPIVSCSTLG